MNARYSLFWCGIAFDLGVMLGFAFGLWGAK